MGLIKSINAPSSLTPFSMRDIENQARSLLAAARQRAEMFLAEAQAEGEKLKAEARAAGLAEGKAEGLAKGLAQGKESGHAQALEEHRSKLTELVNGLTQASADLDASRRHLEADALREVIELSIAIARRVTKRQAEIDPRVMTENLKEAMKLVVHASDVRIAIHPSQKATLESELPQLRTAWPKLEHVSLIDDATLAPGGCRVTTAGGSVDADLPAQLDRVIADLLPDGVPGACGFANRSPLVSNDAESIRETASENRATEKT